MRDYKELAGPYQDPNGFHSFHFLPHRYQESAPLFSVLPEISGGETRRQKWSDLCEPTRESTVGDFFKEVRN